MTEKSSIDEIKSRIDLIYKQIADAAAVRGKSADDIILLAATKTVDADRINQAVSAGVKYVAENRVQELLAKHELIDSTAHQHFIGHLQTNKAKDVVGKVELIHSVHSIKLARELSKQAIKADTTVNILIEVNIGKEKSKSGFEPEKVLNAVKQIAALPCIKVMGLMAIPPICEKAEQNRPYFRQMHKLFIDIGAKNIDNSNMVYLSMGMSDDFAVAIEEGANIVRIGSAIFGKRQY